MHTKIWWSYVHIRYLVHVQKWTYLALGRPYGWALNFNQKKYNYIKMYEWTTIIGLLIWADDKNGVTVQLIVSVEIGSHKNILAC